jgi:NADH-quinone oxidoreductase subunit N
MYLTHLSFIVPEIFLIITAIGFLLVGAIQGNKSTNILNWAAIMAYAIAAIILLYTNWETHFILSDMLVSNDFTGVFKLIILLGLIVSTALSTQHLYQERIARHEYPVLLIFAGVGMMFMVSANNMLALYMGLELQSLSLYILAAFQRNTARSGEAATKYFILGALSSGLMLFGISLIYGFSGSLDFILIRQSLEGMSAIPPGFTIGMVFVLAAVAFKISAAPFHMWSPDVYQGAPTCVTAFFAIVPKVAALALLIRLVLGPFAAAHEQWEQVLYLLAIGSLLFGAFGGIAQTNIKRLMAYSAINHIGYMLIGLIAANEVGIGAVILYALIYMVSTAGVFVIILCMRKEGIAVRNIHSLSGLSQTHPVLATTMAILMFSMSGLPPLAGFFGKLFIFNAAITQGHYALAILGVLASVVAAFYYLRIVKIMFFDKPVDALDHDIGIERRLVLLGSIVFTLGFILSPTYIITFAKAAAASLF